MFVVSSVLMISSVVLLDAHAVQPAQAARQVDVESPAKSDRAKGLQDLRIALGRANDAVRRAKPADDVDAEAKRKFENAHSCEATITGIETGDKGQWTIQAETQIDRTVLVCSVAGDQAIQSASGILSSARVQAEQSLKAFEGAWKPVKSGRPEYIRTHWGGCKKFWPRISEAEYRQQHADKVAQGKRSIDAARDNLESTRSRVTSERRQLLRTARTVRLSVSGEQGALAPEQLKVGQRVRLAIAVESVELATDPPSIKNPVRYVGGVRASMIQAPTVLASAAGAGPRD